MDHSNAVVGSSTTQVITSGESAKYASGDSNDDDSMVDEVRAHEEKRQRKVRRRMSVVSYYYLNLFTLSSYVASHQIFMLCIDPNAPKGPRSISSQALESRH